jgi:hypothetical protein
MFECSPLHTQPAGIRFATPCTPDGNKAPCVELLQTCNLSHIVSSTGHLAVLRAAACCRGLILSQGTLTPALSMTLCRAWSCPTTVQYHMIYTHENWSKHKCVA